MSRKGSQLSFEPKDTPWNRLINRVSCIVGLHIPLYRSGCSGLHTGSWNGFETCFRDRPLLWTFGLLVVVDFILGAMNASQICPLKRWEWCSWVWSCAFPRGHASLHLADFVRVADVFRALDADDAALSEG
jgi:hypothetical protein